MSEIDIKKKILDEYGIDISEENLVDIYGIKKGNLSEEELRKLFENKRAQWMKSNWPLITVEKNKRYLKKAKIYEEILSNKENFRMIYNYLNSRDFKKEKIKFGLEYFRLVKKSNKKVKKEDLDFFFELYKDEAKNRKEIETALKRKHIIKESELKNKDNSNNENANNKFDKNIIIEIYECLSLYKLLPKMRQKRTFYDWLEVDKHRSDVSYKKYITDRRNYAFNCKREGKEGYSYIVDIYNKILRLLEKDDVKKYFWKFKILLRYPELSGYMYAISNINRKVLDSIYKIAIKYYEFPDKTDFILNYFILIYNDFNLDVLKIEKTLKKAEKYKLSNEKKKAKKENKKLKENYSIYPLIVVGIIIFISIISFIRKGSDNGFMNSTEKKKEHVYVEEYIDATQDCPVELWESLTLGKVSASCPSVITRSGKELSSKFMIDGNKDTAWQEGVEGPGIGEYINLVFDDLESVSVIAIAAGAQKNDQKYFENNRLEDITINIGVPEDNYKKYDIYHIHFEDICDTQYIVFDEPVNIKEMYFTIDSVYEGTKWDDTCISEITIY